MSTAGASASPARLQETEDRITFLKRWLRVWIALLVITTLVVVAYLIFIAIALSHVNANVAAANREVRAVRGNVSILPDQINTVNSHLDGINNNLNAVPTRVSRINDALKSVNGSLGVTGTSLADTAGTLVTTTNSLATTDRNLGTINASLQDTNGSLKDTSSLLVSVRDLAGKIDTTLEGAESPPNNLDQLRVCPPPSLTGGSICDGPVTAGAHGIYQRVAITNNPLVFVLGDTGNIVGSLGDVDGHLTSICRALVPQILGLFPPC